jgi:hypothetical protein
MNRPNPRMSRPWLALVVGGLVVPCCPSAHGQATPDSGGTPTTAPTTQAAGTPDWTWTRDQWDAWLTPAPADQPQPKFVCEQTTVDAGNAWIGWIGSPHPVRWRVSNGGAAPLRIRVWIGCRAMAKCPAYVVTAGESIEVEATIATVRRGQEVVKQVSLFTNDRDRPKVELGATMNTRAAVLGVVDGQETPRLSVEFGKLARNVGPQTKTLVLVRGDGAPLKPKIVVPEPATQPVDRRAPTEVLTNLREIEAGQRYELVVTIKPPWPNGFLRRSLRLETGVEDQPEVTVGVSALFPSRLTWRAVSGPVPRQRTQTVRWEANLEWSSERPPGKITAITMSSEGMTARVEEREGQQVLVVEVSPSYSLPEKWQAVPVALETDDPVVPDLEIRVPFEKLE